MADKLRAEALDADEAADLVERCAELAARLGAELDSRRARRRASRRARSACFDVTSRPATYPVELQEKVDAYLEGLRFAAEPGTARLEEAMRYSLLAGGKRIRPVLALATAEALGRAHRRGASARRGASR